ncbi:MAG: helix-turn-helix domain-containing protein [Chitinophagales bacterium]|jgi:transcriptional regulator with XRE-family HTH domain|nr:helix-turn-helix domain-containing protein [Sphingobacteriales bacterium]
MIEKELLWKFGQKLKQLRADRNMSQIELAEKINMEKSNLSRLESGRNNPKLMTLVKLAKALDISFNELLELE